MIAKSAVTIEKDDRIPPRERLITAAGELFYRQGIRAVGVDSIAEAAGTNKMTLYRHFTSKDELVAEYLRESAKAADGGLRYRNQIAVQCVELAERLDPFFR
jgi:AcrR family transcriptional regulator